MLNRFTRLSALIAATGLLLAPLAAAAAPPAKMPMKQPAMHSAAPSKQEIHQFAKVYLKVQSIRTEYRKKLSGEKDKARVKQLQQEGGKAIDAAVENSDLGMKRYNQIAQAASRNKQLKQQLISEIKQMRKSR
ncbi:MAG: DUF4168 domain-containing protein [Gammaproteobacteria bacterium]|jgi:hypothetical protein